MHSINFQLKRAYWSAIRFGRKALEPVEGMTPARFDLMYLLRRVAIVEGPSWNPLEGTHAQSDVWKLLGLHRTTVSRMVRQLVNMRWIRRQRSITDSRTLNLQFTKLGLRKIWHAMRRLFRSRTIRKSYEALFQKKRPDEHPVEAIRHTIRTIQSIARHFGDTSSVWFDFGGGVPKRELPKGPEPLIVYWG